MATIVVGPNNNIRPYRGDHQARRFKEEAAQTFKRGAVLVQDAANTQRVEEAAADPVLRIAGIACDDASGVTDRDVLVNLAKPGAEFIAHIQDGGVLAAGNLGTNYGLVKDGVNLIWRVDTTEVAAVNVTVTELIDAVGDVNGRVAFQFLAAARGLFKG